MTPDGLLDLLRPIATTAATLDLTDPERARAALRAAFPDDAPERAALRAAMLAGRDAGWLCPRTAPAGDVKYGRLAKPRPDLGGCSIDVVDMTGEGAGHVHPNGEVNLGFATEGDPKFLGFPEGFSVFAPGSRHVPTVTGGRMVIAYFLPGGAIVFG